METDQVINAIGQTLDPQFIQQTGLESGRGALKSDPVTLETPMAGVFAGGDCVSGAASVIQAVAAGKRIDVLVRTISLAGATTRFSKTKAGSATSGCGQDPL